MAWTDFNSSEVFALPMGILFGGFGQRILSERGGEFSPGKFGPIVTL